MATVTRRSAFDYQEGSLLTTANPDQSVPFRQFNSRHLFILVTVAKQGQQANRMAVGTIICLLPKQEMNQ